MDEYFDIQDHVIVTNPTEDTFSWMVGGEREYTIEPGQIKRLHGSSARLYVKKMTDLLIIQSNQVQQLHSKELREQFAKELIVKVVSDNEDVEVEEQDLERLARENDASPVKAEVKEPTRQEAFPDAQKVAETVEEVEKVVGKSKEKAKASEPAKPKSTAKSK